MKSSGMLELAHDLRLSRSDLERQEYSTIERSARLHFWQVSFNIARYHGRFPRMRLREKETLSLGHAHQ